MLGQHWKNLRIESKFQQKPDIYYVILFLVRCERIFLIMPRLGSLVGPMLTGIFKEILIAHYQGYNSTSRMKCSPANNFMLILY